MTKFRHWAWSYTNTTVFHYAYTALASISVTLLLVKACGQPPVVVEGQPQEIPQAEDPPIPVPAPVLCGVQPVGSTRPAECPAGEVGQAYEICGADGEWSPAPANSCKPASEACGKVTFADVKPVFDGKCVGCHGQWAGDNYDIVKNDFAKIRYRITSANSGDVMPPQIGLPAADRKLFLDWEAGGFIEEPEDCEASAGLIRIQDANAAMIALAQADIEQRTARGFKAAVADLRFALLTHKVNGGVTAEEFRKNMAGLNKALNAVSLEDDIALCSPVGPGQSICGISLEDFGWTSSDWEAFVKVDPLKIVDNTTSGKILRALTGSNQPWLHADNLAIISQQPAAYYQVRGIPTQLKAYLAQKGVDLEELIRERDVVAAGTFRSPISLQKHRGALIFESDDGFCSITFDPNDKAENLQENPIFNLFNPGKNRFDFKFVAQETICGLENGQQEYGLWAANGLRQDAAPNDVVRDTENPYDPSPTIISAESCQGCHGNEASTSGFLPIEDEVGEFYSRSNGELDAATLDFVRDIYGQKVKLAGIMSAHNKAHAASLAIIGQRPGDGNPYKTITYPFKQNWDLKKLADFLMITEDELKVGVDSSNQLRAQIGSLITGGTITEGAVVAAIPLVIKEMRLFED